ncbi:MAG: tetratricopeptide repeat protein [Chloroflexi bacterium]|nr:tetratricopeptide repeat protein [Chloroflexota bacterium]
MVTRKLLAVAIGVTMLAACGKSVGTEATPTPTQSPMDTPDIVAVQVALTVAPALSATRTPAPTVTSVSDTYYRRGDIQYRRGLAFATKGDYETAIFEYNKAIGLNQDHIDAYYERGRAYSSQGDYDGAIVDFDRAIALDPEHFDAYYQRGLAYANKGDYDRAIDNFDKDIELNPDYAGAYYERGFAYLNRDDYGAAIVDFDKAIELDADIDKAFGRREILASERDGSLSAALGCDNTLEWIKSDWSRILEIQDVREMSRSPDLVKCLGHATLSTGDAIGIKFQMFRDEHGDIRYEFQYAGGALE